MEKSGLDGVQTLGVVFAAIGVVATIAYLVLLRRGVRTLGDIAEELRARRGAAEHNREDVHR